MGRLRNYFAYGSNINLEQMAHRCPDAKVVGVVTLENYELVFRGSSPFSGCGNIEPREGGVVYGLLWQITPQCEEALKRYEGYPHFYDQQTVSVRDAEGKKHTAMVYVMTKQRALVPASPTRSYIACIRDGYVQNGMDLQAFEEALKGCREEIAALREKEQKSVPKQTRKNNHYER